MIPPIFPAINASSDVKALIGASPVRFWSFDSAPRKGEQFYALPYCTWQLVSGLPENNLDSPACMDAATTQIDVWAATIASARDVANKCRTALESVAYVTRWGGEEKETETGLYRISFDVEWIIKR